MWYLTGNDHHHGQRCDDCAAATWIGDERAEPAPKAVCPCRDHKHKSKHQRQKKEQTETARECKADC
jgi:hypothetical protein